MLTYDTEDRTTMTEQDADETRRDIARRAELTEGLRHLANYTGMDAKLNVPDYILADYLVDCLAVFGRAVQGRDDWFGFDPRKVFHPEVGT